MSHRQIPPHLLEIPGAGILGWEVKKEDTFKNFEKFKKKADFFLMSLEHKLPANL